MTRIISAVINIKLIESIRETAFNIFKIESSEEKSVQKENIQDSKKIVQSNLRINDEFGYFNKIER